MPIFAILLLFTGAVLHTAWNLVIKGASEKFIVTWWVVIIGGIASLLALAFTGLPPRGLWGWALLSVAVEALYFALLSYAYRDNDFSLVYPIARGAAPALLAVWSFLLLAEIPTPMGLVGLLFIIAGLLVIGLGSLRRIQGTVPVQGILVALGLALIISVYTLIDGTAVKQGPALPYAFLIFALVPLPLTPFVLRRYGWAKLNTTWQANRLKLVIAGVLGISAYLFALAAYSIAPLNYAGAIREVSVVIGAFAGWRLLGEKMGPVRVAGAAIIFAGILVIARWG